MRSEGPWADRTGHFRAASLEDHTHEIDAQGRVSAYTGKSAIKAAGHRVGHEYSVQANLMVNEEVWPAMAAAYESTGGDLADRLLAALEAAQQAGGDIRGEAVGRNADRQSEEHGPAMGGGRSPVRCARG